MNKTKTDYTEADLIGYEILDYISSLNKDRRKNGEPLITFASDERYCIASHIEMRVKELLEQSPNVSKDEVHPLDGQVTKSCSSNGAVADIPLTLKQVITLAEYCGLAIENKEEMLNEYKDMLVCLRENTRMEFDDGESATGTVVYTAEYPEDMWQFLDK